MTRFDKPDVANVALPEVAVRIDGDDLICQRYDDIYFNRHDGLGETEYVFLQGTRLAEKLAERQHITIAETGFGTGLNFLAACALRDSINRECRIDFISFEACPLPGDLMAHAHRPFAALAKASEQLCGHLPPRWPGYHKVILDEGRTHLHLYHGDALQSLKLCEFAADIWFLDGFNPAKNPDLWQPELCAEVFRCAAQDAQLATFTAAGFVKRALSSVGFTVATRKGYGKKREMIIASKSVEAPHISQHLKSSSVAQSAVIIGGGIAGASLAYALNQRGISSTILEKGEGLASGASGNDVAMQSARLRVHNDAQGRLSVACLSYARGLARQAEATAHHGAVTLNVREKDAKRLAKLAQAGWPEALFQALDPAACSQITGLVSERAGEYQPASAVIYPRKLTAYLAQSAVVRTNCKVHSLIRDLSKPTLLLETGERISADLIFVACGADIPAILSQSHLPEMAFQVSAGQVSHWSCDSAFHMVKLGINYGGYVTPVIAGKQYFGASFNRDGQNAVNLDGHLHNLDLLPPEWRDKAPPAELAEGRLSHRLSTKDRMPVCGQIPCDEGSYPIYMMGALGARGMTHAPLLADMLVAKAIGRPEGLDGEVISALQPQNAMS